MTEYFKQLISSKSDKSSKRSAALYIVFVLGTFITVFTAIKYGDKFNPENLLIIWLGFAAALWGMSEYNKNQNNKVQAKSEGASKD
jgi:hypothetical protein